MKPHKCNAALMCVLLCASALAQVPMTATVDIDTTNVIKTFDKRLVGANIEWFLDGNGIYDRSSQALSRRAIDAAREMGVGVLRFPGGGLADLYLWRDGIGPRNLRPTRPNFLNSGSSPNNFGTPEILTFARETGAEVMMQANIISSTPVEAAAWVRYCNSDTNADRIRDGFPTPYRVKYWEIGNEQYIPAGLLNAYHSLPVSEYVQRFKLWTSFMKSADPTIKVGAVSGKNFGRYTFVGNPLWNTILLQQAAKEIDFIALHNAYGPVVTEGNAANINDVYAAMWGFPLLVEANINDIRRDIQTYAPAEADRIEIAITEWGPLFDVQPTSPWIEHTKTMGSAIFVANLMQVFARTPKVTLATFFKLYEDSFMGAIQANGALKPSYYALQMFGTNFGSDVVRTTVASPAFSSPAVGLVAAVGSVPYLDVVASLSAGGTKLHVIAVNKSTTAPIQATLNISNFNWNPEVTERVLSAPVLDANNGPSLPEGLNWGPQSTLPNGSMFHSGAPGTVATKTTSRTLESNTYTFAPLSVTALEFTRERRSRTR